MGMRNSAPWGQRRISGQLLFLDAVVFTSSGPTWRKVGFSSIGRRIVGQGGQPQTVHNRPRAFNPPEARQQRLDPGHRSVANPGKESRTPGHYTAAWNTSAGI